ncbi:MAG: methionine adenosyltransferase [Synergistaceae bacterium]|nr:methionine adenosyltransferase [Synergistaceae bacterium]
MSGYLLTSESVTEGHPDKLCDQISDAILDEFMSADQYARVAVETMASNGVIVTAGEVTSGFSIDIESVVRKVILAAGYVDFSSGIDPANCLILTNINSQSPDIKTGVDTKPGRGTGAGDQGIMYGYACDETENLMPLTIELAHRLAMRLAEMRKKREIPYLRPDGKAQVTVEYDDKGRPSRVSGIVISAQHEQNIGIEDLRDAIFKKVIIPAIGNERIDSKTSVRINPTGRFVLGGPAADTGLTGRKIMVDTYGGVARHGGGAFSGKDPTKVDRSAAYMARHVAKNLVALGVAKRCEVSVAYSIGMPEPEAVSVDTFGTGMMLDDEALSRLVSRLFPFSVDGIIEYLGLREIKYLPAAIYGHFGRTGANFPWEEIGAIPF